MCTLEFKGDEPTEQDVRAASRSARRNRDGALEGLPEDRVAKMAFGTEEEARNSPRRCQYVKKRHDNSWTVTCGNSKKGGSAAAADEAGDGAETTTQRRGGHRARDTSDNNTVGPVPDGDQQGRETGLGEIWHPANGFEERATRLEDSVKEFCCAARRTNTSRA